MHFAVCTQYPDLKRNPDLSLRLTGSLLGRDAHLQVWGRAGSGCCPGFGEVSDSACEAWLYPSGIRIPSVLDHNSHRCIRSGSYSMCFGRHLLQGRQGPGQGGGPKPATQGSHITEASASLLTWPFSPPTPNFPQPLSAGHLSLDSGPTLTQSDLIVTSLPQSLLQ